MTRAQKAEQEATDLGWRVFGALVLRWKVAELRTAGSGQGAGAPAPGFMRAGSGTRAPRVPCLLPMPSPQGVSIRLQGSDVPTLLRRAGLEVPSGSGIGALFNLGNAAVAAHVARYKGVGTSVLFTGPGLRFLTYHVGVQDVVGSPLQAQKWVGPFHRALGSPAPTPRRLYGKQALGPLPPQEVAAKQRAFGRGANGGYLADHLHGPTVQRYLRKLGGGYVVGDPGVAAPLVWTNSRFILLSAMYKFLQCAFSCRHKPPGVVAAEAALSGTAPRGLGVIGLMDYADTLGEVRMP